MQADQMIEKIIIFYLIIAVWFNTNRWLSANRVIKELKIQRDKYKQAWMEGKDVIVWEKTEEVRSSK
jgi:hypothetical protein